MRKYPTSEYDLKDLNKLEAEPWMIETLRKNPDYVYWGNFEDYMCDKDAGWASASEIETVAELWGLDDYNELVNFYFAIHRDTKECPCCEGNGYNPETKKIADGYYGIGYSGGWQHSLTDDEIQALADYRRLTFDEAKKRSQDRGLMGCDSLDRMTLIETRAKRLGVWGLCENCGGDGREFIENEPRLALQMWFLHPRKGAARGVYLKNVKREEMPRVIEYLKEARNRNADRFSRLDD